MYIYDVAPARQTYLPEQNLLQLVLLLGSSISSVLEETVGRQTVRVVVAFACEVDPGGSAGLLHPRRHARLGRAVFGHTFRRDAVASK